MQEQRFRVARRSLVVANAAVAAIGVLIGLASLVADRPWWSPVSLLLLAAMHGSMAFFFARQRVVLTEDQIVATQGLRSHRVAWGDIERVHLDWAAEAAGRDREVLRIEQHSNPTVRSGAAAGMGGAIGGEQAAHLEAALRERGAEEGFDLEVTAPSWQAAGRQAGRR